MIKTIFEIIGSLGLFLYGMNVMSDGLQKAAGERIQSVLNFMTRNRVSAVFTGFLITCIIQSSSATTVMVVSFVNAQLLTLVQAIGVIMGANIGTTITGWLVALLGFKINISAVAIPIIGIGVPLYFSKKSRHNDAGQVLIGFGLLFLGLGLLKDSVPDIKNNTELLEFLKHYANLGYISFFIFILVGTILTVIVQSSSAAMAITLTMAYAGWIDLYTAAAIVLGENIGTTITAFLASIGTSVNARRASRAHLMFNILGVIWMAFFFRPFLHLVEWIIPGDLTDPGGLPARLALFHTLFNTINTLLWIGFIGTLARLVEKMVPDHGQVVTDTYELKYISGPLQEIPEFNLLNAKVELSKMARILETMFSKFMDVFNNPETDRKEEVEAVKKLEDYTDQMQEKISAFLAKCSKEELNESSAFHVVMMMRIVNELESIGDSIYNLILLSQRRYDKKIILDPGAIQEIAPYIEKVKTFITFISQHLNEPMSEEELMEAKMIEDEIDRTRNTLNKSARSRLRKEGNVKGELMIIDMVRHMEHIGDYSINVAEALRQM